MAAKQRTDSGKDVLSETSSTKLLKHRRGSSSYNRNFQEFTFVIGVIQGTGFTLLDSPIISFNESKEQRYNDIDGYDKYQKKN